ncbi:MULTISPECIES: class I SAM-dependent methyltransferase [unclassified Rhizobium]|uniref:class I SAM-dependent methyltransferase n=1 Tax=unclassified Rhizobium TaxID=2613769 RepID=UPI0009E68D81|nr:MULTISPECIES: class I SAM-dependent methyltransferase [unclassified Rhizobium]
MRLAELKALAASETRFAALLRRTGWRVENPLSGLAAAAVLRPRLTYKNLSAAYYQQLHDEDAGYLENNWLVPEIEAILSKKPDVVVEIGCGNGAFSKEIAQSVCEVHAVDWALSPNFADRPDNVFFHSADLTKDPIPKGSIACSSDVLEHFSPSDLPRVIAKCVTSSPLQYHVIACYDDGHSHLTVMPPGAWLAHFWRYCPSARIERVECRRSNPDQVICVISN